MFTTDTTGGNPKSKYIMGKRNWCAVNWDPASGDLIFDIRVEKEKGHGQTVGYVSAAVRSSVCACRAEPWVVLQVHNTGPATTMDSMN